MRTGLQVGLVLGIGLVSLVAGAETKAKVSEQIAAISASAQKPAAPALHGPRITGATPGRPFLFLIPATGEMPLHYDAQNLPAGLTVDNKTGIISGAIQQEGRTVVTLEVSNAHGKASRTLEIVAEPNSLALTPPMGWNSWNIWARSVDDAKIRAAADAMVQSGLAAHGYQYVNVDDCWAGERDAAGTITGNAKFPDMKALGDYIHAKGLRYGLYSSPGPETCAGCIGSMGFEMQDAKTYASWGMDYLKYDWCSYKEVLADRLPFVQDEFRKPYQIMKAALDACGRDVVYSLSQGGAGHVWEWGPTEGANLWRTTFDIHARWDEMIVIGFYQNLIASYSGPGHWNDPDMLVVGKTKWDDLHLTQDEQITHITLWSLLAAPLLVGCDMTQMDDFTLGLLTNDAMIDVDQDPLGQSAQCVAKQGVAESVLHHWKLADRPVTTRAQIWARPLSNGTYAVGLFNVGFKAGPVKVRWDMFGLEGSQPVYDVWMQKDLGMIDSEYIPIVPRHGAVFLIVGKPTAG